MTKTHPFNIMQGNSFEWKWCGCCEKPLPRNPQGTPIGSFVQIGSVRVSVLCATCAKENGGN